MRRSFLGLIASLVLLGGASQALADPVDVTYTVSGSPTSWLLDFSVTNNLGANNDINFFGTQLPARNIAGSPPGWDPEINLTWDNSPYGGSSTIYNNNWVTNPVGINVIYGTNTVSGFQVLVADLVAPTNVPWFAWSYNVFGDFAGSGCFNCSNFNPGFEGTATAGVAAVPLPAALPLFAGGLGLMGWMARRRRGQAAHA